MTNKRRWKILNNIEDGYRKRFLKRLTEKKSFEIFNNLYEFGQRLAGKSRHKNLDKIENLSKIHFLFMKAK